MSLNILPEVSELYHEIRNKKDVSWGAFGYQGDKTIHIVGKGNNYEDFIALCTQDVCLYGYVTFFSGDKFSQRKKFVFITWIGDNVGALKKGRMSVHKAEIKKIINEFAVELQPTSKEELRASSIDPLLRKAGGADYGSG